MTPTKLTRRRLLVLGAGAAIAPSLGRNPLAQATAAVPRAHDFSMPVPDGAFAGAGIASRRGHVSSVLRAPARFDLVGLRWPGRERPRVELRTRTHGGRWSDWVALPLAGDHRPDGSAPIRGTEPAWMGSADELQLRVDRRVGRMRAHFVNATGTLTAIGRVRAGVRKATSAARRAITENPRARTSATPRIIPRKDWGGDTLPPKGAPEYGTVKLAFVHHTVGANDYAREDSAAIVLGIAKYHRNVNGWNDIGYNFLVDKYGQIFEGRAGGIERAVVGAQAAGYNSASTGISNLGTFSTEQQTDDGVAACASVIAWKLGLHGVPVSGTVVANGKTFERISGHRDANSTACPGDALYDQLPRIRALAAQGGGPAPPNGSLTLQATTRNLTAGESAMLSGVLVLADGSHPQGVTVELQARGANGYRTSARTRTGPGGRWSLRFKRSQSTRVRVRCPKLPDGRRLTSASLRIAVAPAITIGLGRKRVPTGSSVVVAGKVTPAKRSLIATVQRRSAGGSFKTVATRRLSARGGRYRDSVRLAHSGLHRISVRSIADARNSGGSSKPLTVRVGGGKRKG